MYNSLYSSYKHSFPRQSLFIFRNTWIQWFLEVSQYFIQLLLKSADTVDSFRKAPVNELRNNNVLEQAHSL